MVSDVNTVRRAFECMTHFGVCTATCYFDESMMCHGYSDYAGIYLTIPSECRTHKCKVPIAHLVKILVTCMSHSMVRLTFHASHFLVENEVQYRVEYVSGPIDPLIYPTVRSCGAYHVALPTLHRFIKLSEEDITLTEGLTLTSQYQGVIKSTLTFPPYEGPLYVRLDVPLNCGERWPDSISFSSTLMRYLCRTQSFQTSGVMVVCAEHLVWQATRGDVGLKLCFTKI